MGENVLIIPTIIIHNKIHEYIVYRVIDFWQMVYFQKPSYILIFLILCSC